MADKSNVLPSIIRAEYDPGTAIPDMVADARRAAGQVKSEFDKALGKGSMFKVDADSGVFAALTKEASSLRAQLDPLFAAQQRFNKEMDRAETYLAAGVISQREYASATQMARDALQQANTAIHATTAAMAKMANAKPLDLTFGVERLMAGKASVDSAAMSMATLESVMGRLGKASATAGGEVGRAKAEVAAAAAAMANLYREGSKAVETGRLIDAIYRNTAEAFGHASKSARESSQVFEQAFAQQDRAAKETAAAAQALNELQAAARNAAETGRLLDAIYRGTSDAFGQTAKSARESAAVFEQAFAQQEKATREASLAAEAYAKDLELVRRAIDPTRVAQQQLDAELGRAEQALARGSITMEQYGRAVNAAADNYQMMVTGARQGTTANHMMVNSTQSLRQATVQAGQQLQDIGISLYSGQRASVVFAQQLPQLAFALSGLEGSANKTHATIGRFATFLSGPWGLAVGLAVGVSAQFIASLISSGDEADKSARANRSLSEVLNDSAASWKEVTEAAQAYVDNQKRAREVTIETLKLEAQGVAVRLNKALAIRQELQAELELRLERERTIAAGSRGDPGASGAISGAAALTAATQRGIDANKAALETLTKLSKESVIAVAGAVAELNTDPTAQTRAGFDVLRNSARETIKDVNALAKRLADLNKQEKAALDALSASGSRRSSGGSAYSRANSSDREASVVRFLSPVDGRTTSGFGPRRHPVTGKQSFHAGVDYAVPVGTPVRAPADGVVKEVGRSSGNGIFVRLDHGAGTETTFLHLSKADVVEGQVLSAGDYFAKSGNTGMSTGPHLDYRVKVGGQNVDPSRGSFRVGSFAETAGRLEERMAEEQERMAAREMEIRQRIAETLDRQRESVLEIGEAQERNLEIQSLIAEGRIAESEALQLQYRIMDQLGVRRREDLAAALEMAGISDAEYQQLQQNLVLERQMAREIEKQNALRQQQVALIEQTQENMRDAIYGLLKGDGLGAIGNLFKRQFDLIIQDMADQITESLFGDMFRNAKDKALGFDKVKEASLAQARTTKTVTSAIADLGNAARGAASALGGVAANDNVPDELAQQFDEAFNAISIQAPQEMARTLQTELKGAFKKLLGEELTSKLSKSLATVMQGAAYGQMASGLAKSLGMKQSKLGSQIGGSIGMAVGGPIGAMVGGFIGGTIGGLFKKKPKGSATITGDGVSVSGSSKLRDGLNSLGGQVFSSLESIAEALGGDVGDFSTVIKQKGKKYRVNGQKFKDEGEAMRAAILDALQQGAIRGITEGAQRLLKAGQDIDKQLAKAVKFQGVFDELRQIKDPAGFAITKLNREFENLIDIFREAGASAEEFAQLEELYGIKRAKALEEATEATIGSLRQLIEDLTTGDNGLSLRDRMANAQAAFNPLAAAIQAGEKVDYDKFAEASRTMLDIARQLYGSQDGYFDLFNKVLGLSNQAIGREQGALDTATGMASPFTNLPAPSAATVPVVSALGNLGSLLVAELGYRLDAVNDNIARLGMTASATGTGGLVLSGGRLDF